MTSGAYIARVDLDDPAALGVLNKIKAQRTALSDSGFSTELFAKRSGAIALNDIALRPVPKNSFERRANHYFRFFDEAKKVLIDSPWLYVRLQGADPGFCSFLSEYKSRNPEAPVVLEIATWPYKDERQGWRKKILGSLEDHYVGKATKFIDRIVTYSSANTIFGTPTIRISNGVDPGAVAVSKQLKPDDTIRIAAVANHAHWHGYDRIISGLADFQDNERAGCIHFEIIGAGSELPKLKRLCRDLDVENIVHFHGPLSGPALDDVLDRCHVGVGCLGLHRVTKDTSDLKSREYCARGLPFIATEIEPDFQTVSQYVHIVPRDDSPVDMTAVANWLSGLEGAPISLRRHAEANLTWHAKFKPVVDWLHARLAKPRT